MARRFLTIELDEDEVDFLLTYDPEKDPSVDWIFSRGQLIAAYRRYVATVQSYIADGLT
jgi:hypothetical protein